jgi:hypothetical protein
MNDLEDVYIEIKKILEKHSGNFLVKDHYIGSKAKDDKPAYHLYGRKEVSLFGKEPKKTYIAGVIKQKNYVSFYFSPIYSHPESFQDLSPELEKYLKGKSCFNLKKLSPEILQEIEDLLIAGIKKYKELEWI